MSQGYRFFFSYARENCENARWTNLAGREVNLLEQFFEALCHRVSDLTGDDLKDVAYRDQDKLQISDLWSTDIVRGLQQSRVLVALLSPHYLKKPSCLKELEFFRHRFYKWQQTHPNQTGAHRIVPVFWVDSINSLRGINKDIVDFINSLQQKQKGIPDNYPAKGLFQFYSLNDSNSLFTIIEEVAERIKTLSNEETLPPVNGTDNFYDLPLNSILNSVSIANGPSRTNVFYAVGTVREMQSVGCSEIQSYGMEPQDWKPFLSEHPGATIKLITEEGLNAASQEEPHCNLGSPENLLEKIEIAQKKNSPVLIILDRCVLKLDRFKKAIQDYDGKNYYHVGLVTAGGAEITDEAIAKICMFKYKPGIDHHIWLVPKDRNGYIHSVTEVVRGLRKKIKQMGTPSINASSERKPELDISPVT